MYEVAFTRMTFLLHLLTSLLQSATSSPTSSLLPSSSTESKFQAFQTEAYLTTTEDRTESPFVEIPPTFESSLMLSQSATPISSTISPEMEYHASSHHEAILNIETTQSSLSENPEDVGTTSTIIGRSDGGVTTEINDVEETITKNAGTTSTVSNEMLEKFSPTFR